MTYCPKTPSFCKVNLSHCFKIFNGINFFIVINSSTRAHCLDSSNFIAKSTFVLHMHTIKSINNCFGTSSSQKYNTYRGCNALSWSSIYSGRVSSAKIRRSPRSDRTESRTSSRVDDDCLLLRILVQLIISLQ